MAEDIQKKVCGLDSTGLGYFSVTGYKTFLSNLPN